MVIIRARMVIKQPLTHTCTCLYVGSVCSSFTNMFSIPCTQSTLRGLCYNHFAGSLEALGNLKMLQYLCVEQ